MHVTPSLIPVANGKQATTRLASVRTTDGGRNPAAKMTLGELEPEYDRSSSGEQNGSPTDSQADCRQIGPPRRLVKLQTAVFASRSGKATESPATRTLSHTKPPPRAAGGSLHRPGLIPIRENRLT